MKAGRTGRILGAALLVLGGAVAVLYACGEAGRIHGTVTESVHSSALPYAFMGLTSTADSSYVSSTCTDVNGDYEFTGLMPDGYTVTAGHMGYQPETANVTVTAGGDVDKDFVLDPIPANVKADVVSLDQVNGTRTGGQRSVQVRITHQMMCHDPLRLVVWAYGGSPTARPYVIFDSGETGWWYCYPYCLDPTVSPNPACSGYDTIETLRFPWNTCALPNGSYTIKAALKCSDPHKDGVDENPDPAVESWVHWAGSPPTTTADGTPGGSTLGIDVVNVVITGYSATPSGHPQHYFKYDADGGTPLDSPGVTVTVANWQNEPMEIVVWMMATAWGDTRPLTATDPYMCLAITTPGTYTLTWDGSNPGLSPPWGCGWGPGEAPWGTYTYDIDVHKPSYAASTDHFFAKTHDGWSTTYANMYDTRFGDHSVDWTQETINDPLVLRCTYVVTSGSSTAPTWVELVPVDPNLTERGCVSGGVTLGVTHDGIPPTGAGTGPGIATFSTTNPDDTVGTWRVVLTGQTASGAEHRRDGTNPVMLATNDVYCQEGVFVFLNNASDGGIITLSAADPDPARVADAIKKGLRMPCTTYLRALNMYMYSNDHTQYPSLTGSLSGSHQHWGFLMGDKAHVERNYPGSIRHAITVSQREFPATVLGVGAGHGHNWYYGWIYRPDVTAIDTERLRLHAAGPAPASPAEMVHATTHAILHELGHRLGLTCHDHDHLTGQCVMDEDVQAFLYTDRFTGTGWEAAMWGGTPHIDDHQTEIRVHLCW